MQTRYPEAWGVIQARQEEIRQEERRRREEERRQERLERLEQHSS